MDMSPVAVAVVLVLVIVVGGGAFFAIRLFGGRAFEGDHPGEKGYDAEDHRPD